MTAFEQMIAPLKKYAEFSGRASRSEFWYFLLFVTLATAAARIFGAPIAGFVSLALLCPQLAVAVRRLHDVGRSGKELIVPLVMLVAAPLMFLFGGFLGKIVQLGYYGIVLLMFARLVSLFIKEGKNIPNRYGAAPGAFSFGKA